MDDKACTIYGDGTSEKDYIYIDDLLEGIILASTSEGVSGEVFQIATGVGNDVNKVTAFIDTFTYKMTKTRLKVEYGPERDGDVSYGYCDISKAKRILKYSPKYNLSNGIEKTVDWYMKNYGGNRNG